MNIFYQRLLQYLSKPNKKAIRWPSKRGLQNYEIYAKFMITISVSSKYQQELKNIRMYMYVHL